MPCLVRRPRPGTRPGLAAFSLRPLAWCARAYDDAPLRCPPPRPSRTPPPPHSTPAATDSSTAPAGAAPARGVGGAAFDGSGMWGVVILFVVLVAIVSLIALCYHSRRQNQRRRLLALPTAAPGGGGGIIPLAADLPGARLGVVAAESPSGRHIIFVGVPNAGAYGGGPGAAAAPPALRARQLAPNEKLPTPPSVIANLPTYQFHGPPAAGGDGDGKDGDGGGGVSGGGAPLSSVDGADPNRSTHRQVCVICCDEFEEGTTVKLLPCMHSFCADCIDAWLARDTHCPIWWVAEAGARRGGGEVRAGRAGDEAGATRLAGCSRRFAHPRCAATRVPSARPALVSVLPSFLIPPPALPLPPPPLHCVARSKESVLRAAGMSEADALELVASSAAGDAAGRRRQIDGAEGAARAWGGRGGAGAGGVAGVPVGGVVDGVAAFGGRRGPDLQLQAQQQRLWQLSRQQRAQQQIQQQVQAQLEQQQQQRRPGSA